MLQTGQAPKDIKHRNSDLAMSASIPRSPALRTQCILCIKINHFTLIPDSGELVSEWQHKSAKPCTMYQLTCQHERRYAPSATHAIHTTKRTEPRIVNLPETNRKKIMCKYTVGTNFI